MGLVRSQGGRKRRKTAILVYFAEFGGGSAEFVTSLARLVFETAGGWLEPGDFSLHDAVGLVKPIN